MCVCRLIFLLRAARPLKQTSKQTYKQTDGQTDKGIKLHLVTTS